MNMYSSAYYYVDSDEQTKIKKPFKPNYNFDFKLHFLRPKLEFQSWVKWKIKIGNAFPA